MAEVELRAPAAERFAVRSDLDVDSGGTDIQLVC
jgi:predicted protein tyrosine phosphatase